MNTFLRIFRFAILLILIFILFGVLVPGYMAATRFRKSPTAREFIDIFSGTLPSHALSRHLALLEGTQNYEGTMDGWFIKYAAAISNREENKQLVDSVLERLSPSEWASHIHNYPFETAPPHVGTVVFDALEHGNVEAAALCARFDQARPAVVKWIGDHQPEADEPATSGGSETFDEGAELDEEWISVFRTLATVAEDDAVAALRSLYAENRYAALELAEKMDGARFRAEAERLVREEFRGEGDIGLSRLPPDGIALLMERVAKLSAPTALELIQQLAIVDSGSAADSDRMGFDSSITGLARGVDGRVEPSKILLDAKLLDWVEKGAGPEAIGEFFGILFRSQPLNSAVWERFHSLNLTPGERGIAFNTLIEIVCDSGTAEGEPSGASVALAARLLEAERSPHLVSFLWNEKNTRLKADLVEQIVKTNGNSAFGKDCVLAAVGSGTPVVAPRLDDVFRGGERPELPFAGDFDWAKGAMADSEVVELYCRITGKKNYWEVGKSWPPMCKRALSHTAEIEALKNFIIGNPWFPGLDDAYYRLGFLQFASGDAAGAEHTLREALERDFVDRDCHWEISYLYRLTLCDSAGSSTTSGTAAGLSRLYRDPLGLVVFSDDPDTGIGNFVRLIEELGLREPDRCYFFLGDDTEDRDRLIREILDLARELSLLPETERLSFLCQRLENVSPAERAKTLFFHVRSLPNNKTDSELDCYHSSDFRGPADSYQSLDRCLRILDVEFRDAPAERRETLDRFVRILESVIEEMAPGDGRNLLERFGTGAKVRPDDSMEISMATPMDLPTEDAHMDGGVPAQETDVVRGYNDLAAKNLAGALAEGDPHGAIDGKIFIVLIARNGVVSDVVRLDEVGGADSDDVRSLVGLQLDPPPLPEGFTLYRLVLRIQTEE